MDDVRKDVYNPKIIKYWVELKTSASMEARSCLEVKDSTTAETTGHVDSEGYAAMGDLDMSLSGGPFGTDDMPGSSNDAPSHAPSGSSKGPF